MPSRIKPLIRHALHIAAAGAATALIGFVSQNSEQITSAVPAHWQGIAASVILFIGAIKYGTVPPKP